MKNKKLFAILTLVCFMFTLMPVAAFAAADPQASTVYTAKANPTVEQGEEVKVNFKLDADATNLYVWFEEVGYEDVVSSAVNYCNVGTLEEGLISLSNVKSGDEITVKFSRDGEYKLHAATTKPENGKLAENTANELRIDSSYNVVTVDTEDKTKTSKYQLVIKDGVTLTGGTDKDGDGKIDKNDVAVMTTVGDGAAVKAVSLELVDVDGKTVSALDAKVTATSGVDVSDVEVTRFGKITFDVTANKVGTHKVYIAIGDFKATIKVDATDSEADSIEVYYVSQTPINIDSANEVGNAHGYGITGAQGLANYLLFKVYDANGNEMSGDAAGMSGALTSKDKYDNRNYVALTEKPAGSSLKSEDFAVAYAVGDPGKGYTIVGKKNFDKEGTYSFKVVLDNGKYAKVSITVKEAGDPVRLNITYNTDSVQLGAKIAPKAVVWLDANNVSTKVDFDSDNVEFAVSGVAVESVAAQTITVKDDEKYVGSEIKVTVVDEENNLVATKVLTVATEAKELTFDTKEVPVDTTRTVTVKLVDENGKSVGLNSTTAEAYVIVLDKPADSDVTIGDAKNVNATKGQFTFTISGDKVGTVKLQAVFKATVDNVVRYYTGTTEIKVGATGIEDTVVMSIGANKIVVNDKVVVIDAAPMIKDSRTFVPFRALAEAFGATVAYDEATQSVTAELDGTTVVMTIGSTTYTVNGVEKTADVAPFINGSRTMVPVRFVAEAFGINVTAIAAEDGSVADVLFTK